MIIAEKELEILNTIYSSPEQVHQRDLANKSGMSLGMTNAILKRLAKKGFLMIRKVNNRNIQYVVSPEGVDAIARRSYRYLKRTIKNVVQYKDFIENYLKDIKTRGYTDVSLIGKSDVDFMVEHFCRKLGMEYCAVANNAKVTEEKKAGRILMYAETVGEPPAGDDTVSLRRVLTGETLSL